MENQGCAVKIKCSTGPDDFKEGVLNSLCEHESSAFIFARTSSDEIVRPRGHKQKK